MSELDPTEFGLKASTKTVWRDLQVKGLDVDSSRRTVVARITSDAVDEEGEVVVPEGIDYSRFLKTGGVVFFNHEYDQPCGTCISITHTDRGILATTKFPDRPEGYRGDWLPDQVFAMFASDPPIVKSFSIGFAYLETRAPNAKDFKKYGRDDIKRIISKSKLLEYSVAPLPMNADATAIQINKAVEASCHPTDTCFTQAPDPDPNSIGRSTEGAEWADVAQPVRVSDSQEKRDIQMSEDISKKMMVDLNPSMTIGELAAALASSKADEDKDEAEKVRSAVDAKVSKEEEEKRMKEDEKEKADMRDDEDKKSIQDLAMEVKRLNDQSVSAGRSRLSAGMPRIEAPARGNLKHLKSHDAAYGFGKFILGAAGHKSSAQWVRDHYGAKAHSEGNNSLGGFLVPDELDQSIIDLRAEYGKFRANTRVLTMSRDVLQINRRAGGLTAIAVGENGSFTESENSFDQVTLTAAKFGVLTKVSSELLEDAVVNLGDYVAGEIAYAFANKEDDSGFNGDGSSSFAGIVGLKNAVGSAGIASVANTGDIYAGLALSDLNAVVGKAPEYVFSRATPKWYFSSQFYYGAVQKVIYAAGGNTVDTITGGGQQQLFGYPVVLSDVLAKTHATSTIFGYFGALDLSSTMGDRRPTEVATSTDFAFNQDQTAIRGTTRFDIVNHDCGDSSDAGAIVALKSNAS